MPWLRSWHWLVLLIVGLIAYSWIWWADHQSEKRRTGPPLRRDGPSLAVLIVFDQLRGDYLGKWQDLFGEGGFKRMRREGAWFTNCHYPFADTLTAPGHVSLVTGCSPNKHGIIANEWHQRDEAALVESIASVRCRPVPPAKDPKVKGADPRRCRQETVGEVLLRQTHKQGRVVGLSIKDRAAILLAALQSFFVYWFSTSFGGFVTSTHYTDALHPIVAQFNQSRFADRWFDKTWNRLRPDLDYHTHSGPDDVFGEGVGYEQGAAFPHPFNKVGAKLDKDYYSALTNSPQGNEVLLELAKRTIDGLQLGQREHPDLLCLGFSCNDLIGHCWGPDSQEVLDVTLHSDRLMKDLLDHLDARVGPGNYVVVVTADHGVCPLPEVAKARGEVAGRVPVELITARAPAHLQETFAKDQKPLPWIEATAGPWIYLNQGVIQELKLTPTQVEQALADYLAQQPGVAGAVTRAQLQDKDKLGDPLLEMFRLSFDPDRSGDVRINLRPNHILSDPLDSARSKAYRTTHGSPYPYDTYVPLLVLGRGVQGGIRSERITPLATAAILARALGIPPPDAAEAPLPHKLFVD